MSATARIEVSLATFKAIEAARLSFGESHDEIVARMLASPRNVRANVRAYTPITRRRGNVSVDLFGRMQPVANLKAAYIATLTSLLRHKPSLFEHLSQEGRTRRRWIARSADGLYADSPHLACNHAYEILPGWFLDTNLSRAQIDQRLAVACKIAGYRYGEDARIVEGAVA